MLTQKRVYIAGPMRGIKDFNFPAFHRIAELLRIAHCEVFNPAENDETKHGKIFSEESGCEHELAARSNWTLRGALRADTSWIIDHAEAICLLSGWKNSKGATAERALGIALGLEIWETDGVLFAPQSQSTEIRVTDPVTGGQKGQKLERFDLIPVEPMMELARVYGRGSKKYSDNNWRKGYSWRLSFGAMMRHAWLWWWGQDRDEDGNHHLACVQWHCCTLATFARIFPQGDDRPDKSGQ